jgi:hypothetical protein
MPDDITNIGATSWSSVTLAQNETWQVILGSARISLDTTPAIESMPLESGLLLKNFATINLTSGDTVRYRRASAAALTIARSKR